MVVGFLQALAERNDEELGVISGLGVEEPNHWHSRLLRPRHHRPRRRTSDPRDELPSPH
jgi:hypothetical protein